MSDREGLSALADLEGRWTLYRRITHADGQINEFHGHATFTLDGDQLVLDEEGVLSGLPGGATLNASRRYMMSEEADHIAVFFNDMRPFHAIPLGVARPEANHDCPPDTYAVSYDFSNLDVWRASWSVSGPRKSYVMNTRYTRAQS